jgi:hypothetical protein
MNEFSIQSLSNSVYKIHFKYPCKSIINSVLKTRLINGGSTDQMYKTLTFKATSVSSLREEKHSVASIVHVLECQTKQLEYLIQTEHKTMVGYNPTHIVVINDTTYLYVSDEYLVDIEEDNNITIGFPFSCKDFFIAPELLKMSKIPSKIHYKSCYYSLALLVIYMLMGNDDFYNQYLSNPSKENALKAFEFHSLKYSKLYWLLSRCMNETISDRSILFI